MKALEPGLQCRWSWAGGLGGIRGESATLLGKGDKQETGARDVGELPWGFYGEVSGGSWQGWISFSKTPWGAKETKSYVSSARENNSLLSQGKITVNVKCNLY